MKLTHIDPMAIFHLGIFLKRKLKTRIMRRKGEIKRDMLMDGDEELCRHWNASSKFRDDTNEGNGAKIQQRGRMGAKRLELLYWKERALR